MTLGEAKIIKEYYLAQRTHARATRIYYDCHHNPPSENAWNIISTTFIESGKELENSQEQLIRAFGADIAKELLIY